MSHCKAESIYEGVLSDFEIVFVVSDSRAAAVQVPPVSGSFKLFACERAIGLYRDSMAPIGCLKTSTAQQHGVIR